MIRFSLAPSICHILFAEVVTYTEYAGLHQLVSISQITDIPNTKYADDYVHVRTVSTLDKHRTLVKPGSTLMCLSWISSPCLTTKRCIPAERS
ncbi:hypothetical protein QBC37DRAFT_408326 [Rhypophila decipiens]|uniref:Uncharacterized protein n=1 Tax=Rhypophila decipiens TaxID=261697 RepID=A0AAN6YK94_9PEZI|nr:hypothetical protein QBC37DRAFT_408326 [Rhypophila decipiens]